MRECTELSIMGFAHNRMAITYSAQLSRLLESGGKLKVLTMDPNGSAILEANTRSYAPKPREEAMFQHKAAIATLTAIGRKAPDPAHFELRVMNYVPPFTIYLFAESTPDAHVFVWLTPWRMPSSQRPGFRLTAKVSPKWYPFFAGQLHQLWNWENTHAFS